MELRTRNGVLFTAWMDSFPSCCGLAVLSGFTITNGRPMAPDWDEIREAIKNQLSQYNLMTVAVTVGLPSDNFDYNLAHRETQIMHDFYRMLEGMGTIIKTFRNPVHNSTLNLVLLNPQQLGVSTYDFG